MSTALGRRGEGYVVVQFILLGLIALAPLVRLGGAWPEPLGLALRGVGGLLILAGGGLALAGLLGLGVDNLSALPHPKDEAQLVETGIYGLARHPIYGGLVLGAAGWGLLTHSLLALALTAALWAWFELKSRREEAALRQKFAGYAAYARRVRRFWPGVY
jgi:protein-S-isoprenylcysteine O-methyltransferase Ste14